jgi:hypothetical protein
VHPWYHTHDARAVEATRIDITITRTRTTIDVHEYNDLANRAIVCLARSHDRPRSGEGVVVFARS